MSAVLVLPLPRPLCDVRPARGKHRTRLSVGDLADRLIGAWRRARVEFAVGAAALGGVAAAVLS